MYQQLFPFPPSHPLQRLHVFDSLMMNAARWQFAHDYHRQRQNLHYQSLFEPGIVCGLGVRVISAPDTAPQRFKDIKDKRWLEIQPGIAIDCYGNPIIVDGDTDRTFRLATAIPTKADQTVYLVVSYVEPTQPSVNNSSEAVPKVREWFRIDERDTPPEPHEVELCRITLPVGKEVQLQHAADVLSPGYHQLDFSDRTLAKVRPQAVIQIATTSQNHYNLSSLMESVSYLYPPLQGNPSIGQVSLNAPSELTNYDLVYLPAEQVENLPPEQLKTLQQYLSSGGVLLIEAAIYDPMLEEKIKNIIDTQLKIQLKTWQQLDRKHLLCSRPFLFGNQLLINQQFLDIWHDQGVIFITGSLSTAWGVDDNSSLQRHEIRTAQELGINILHFALQRRHLTQLSQKV